jgi:transcriptional regulator with XRE-family HTH domain
MNAFKKMRIKKNLTQSQAAKFISVDKSTISKWENGGSFPRAETLTALARIYECTTDELLSFNNESTVNSHNNQYCNHF